MRSAVPLAALCGLLAAISFGQNAEKPRFLAADVHVSGKTQWDGSRPPISRAESLEAKNVTLADLIAFAYNSNITKVVGGPSWLEMDRYDVIAKAPPQTTPDQQKVMLQALLAERFKLVAREDSRPMPNYALTNGGKHKLKESDKSEAPGCTPQSSSAAPGANTLTIGLASPDGGGTPVRISLANGMIEYKCRNMTMAAFAAGLRNMLVANLGVNPVLDQTGLAGNWNFDLKYSLGLIGLPGAASGDTVTIFDAVEKQMGLKLEQKQVPTTVMVVESVERKPIDNPPGTAEALPPAAPKEFEVATIKATGPDSKRQTFSMQPGGRLVSEGLPFSFLINRAFNPRFSGQVVGIPSWADTARFDVMAQAASDGPQINLDPDTLAPLMLSLLKERFGLTYHTEQRELQAYDLVAAKPKMKKADPEARSWCKAPQQVPGAPPAPQGSQALICQNVTMAQFAELLRGRTPDMQAAPIGNATNLEGGWDFTLTFNPVAGLAAAIRPADTAAVGAAPTPIAAASEPVAGITIFEAVDKQLGLKLEKVKRSMPVTVIDHIDQTPTDN